MKRLVVSLLVSGLLAPSTAFAETCCPAGDPSRVLTHETCCPATACVINDGTCLSQLDAMQAAAISDRVRVRHVSAFRTLAAPREDVMKRLAGVQSSPSFRKDLPVTLFQPIALPLRL